jgi:NitT/TauT family transport system ATP-binding protein
MDGPAEPKVALLHQDYRQTNFPWASALENVTYPLRFTGVPADVRNLKGTRVLAEFLPEVAPDHRAYELSGGQQQLLAISRALAAEPDILLGDEPLSAIDTIRGLRAIQAIEQAWQTSRFTMIWISHDIDEALLLGDSLALLSQRKRGFDKIITNPLPRPRTPTDLAHPEMARLKAEILEFLLSESSLNGG